MASIVLDGPRDEDAWRDVSPLPMVMYVPTFGGPPTERSEVRLAHDDNFLFVSARLFMSDASKIRCPSKKRDYFEPKWGNWRAWKPSLTRDIVLENVRSRRPLYVVPYGAIRLCASARWGKIELEY